MSDLAERRARQLERERREKAAAQEPVGRGVGSLKRVTVNLTPRGAQAIKTVAGITGDTRTDIINRAVQVYAEVQQVLSRGGALYVRPEKDADVEQLRIW